MRYALIVMAKFFNGIISEPMISYNDDQSIDFDTTAQIFSNLAHRGASGPTTTRSGWLSLHQSTIAATSVAFMGRHCATSAMPAFPGAHQSSCLSASCDRRHAIACSRPPLPTTRILMARIIPHPAERRQTCNSAPQRQNYVREDYFEKRRNAMAHCFTLYVKQTALDRLSKPLARSLLWFA